MISHATISDSPKSEDKNEDTYWCTGNIVFAIDGATGLSDRKLVRTDMSDARWIALQYRGAILALAEEYRNHTLRELVDACRIRVVERFVTESDFALSELSAIEYPSATLALVRITDDRVDTALFSDTTMALRIGDRVVIPTDERLKRYDESALRAFREALARWCSIPEANALRQNLARANRRHMNEAGDSGYAVLSLHVNTAEMGRYESFDRQARVPVYGLLATDGFAAAAIAYGLSPDYRDLLERSRSDSGFLDAMLARIRDVEEGDPDCRRYLRFKKGDDATAVVFEAQA